MRHWLIKKLGGVPKQHFDNLLKLYEIEGALFERTIEIHKMQGAQQEALRELKARRYH